MCSYWRARFVPCFTPRGGTQAPLALRGGCLPALAPRRLLRGALAAAAAAARLAALARAGRLAPARVLAALLRRGVVRAGVRVRYRSRAALAHALLAQALVLLVVLDAGSMVLGHLDSPFVTV